MSRDEQSERVDHLLDVLSKPLSRYILSVLVGADPGVYVETSEDSQKEDDKNDDS